MKTVKDESMKKLIESWGLPKWFQNRNEEVLFKFDDEGIKNTNEEGYFIRDGYVKFCLFAPATGSALFTMDFFKISPTHNGIPSAINLELVYVHQESLRKNGIASYYIQKLIQYAIREKMEFIKVTAIADAENFKDDTHINALSQDELEAFYRKFDSPEMPIKVSILEIYE
jgi:hypothetical protein